MAESLSSSVSSLRSSLQLLESSINILDSGVNDFPRLSKTLQITRHFELLPELALREAQQAILNEITPSIAHLLSLASNQVDRLARRGETLRAKCQLQEGRLSDDQVSYSAHTGCLRDHRTVPTSGDSNDKAAELKRLRQKKERLKYAVDRLELQSRQRERELRRSMAAQ
ncbi:DASH complex subunit Spc19 [Elaphomyces granulatus]